MLVKISIGELFDKLTILEIKADRIREPSKRKNIQTELAELATVSAAISPSPDAVELIVRLREVNEALWDIEDKIRLCERQRKFDDYFVELARSVYIQNDKRAYLKKQLNIMLGSELVEEKSYRVDGDNK